jgi:hypothetical protein
MAILAALALLNAQHHALGVDIRYLQGNDLGHAQPGAVGNTQRRYLTPGAASRKRAALPTLWAALPATVRKDLPLAAVGVIPWFPPPSDWADIDGPRPPARAARGARVHGMRLLRRIV